MPKSTELVKVHAPDLDPGACSPGSSREGSASHTLTQLPMWRKRTQEGRNAGGAGEGCPRKRVTAFSDTSCSPALLSERLSHMGLLTQVGV